MTMNERIVFFILNDYNRIVEYQFKKNNEHNEHNKHNQNNIITYVCDSYSRETPSHYMDLKKFKQHYFDSSNLNFCCTIGNKLKPHNFIEWLFSNKNKYEINKGKIYKLSKIKNTSDTFTIRVGVKYTQEELLNIINMFENIEVGEFTNNYTQKYYNKNVNFIKNEFLTTYLIEMINTFLSNPINIEKKQSKFGLCQDIFTLIYCSILIPVSIYNLYYNTNIIDWKVNLFSYIYFIITGIINLYYLEYNFVLHHVVCVGLIWIGNYNKTPEYYTLLSKCYLAEISNVFLASKNILRTLRNSYMIKTKIYENINDILFVITYFGIRMFYLLPYVLAYLYQNYKSEFKFEYFEFILINIILMAILNLHWSYLIIKKIKKIEKNI